MKKLSLLFLLLILTGCATDTVNTANYVVPQAKSNVETQTVQEVQEVKKVTAPSNVIKTDTKVNADVPLSNDNYYTNSAGDEVHSPAYAPSVPAGASAICGDGTYSFSKSRRGTCSHHGGVAQWL